MAPHDDQLPENPPLEPEPGDPAATEPASAPPVPTSARWGGLLAIGVVVLAVLILLLGFFFG